MPCNIRIVSTYPPRACGIGTFSRHLANALANFTGEVGYVRIAAIDKEGLAYNIPVDLIIDQYNPRSWQEVAETIASRAKESPNPTVVLLQHEYGLDPAGPGKDGEGKNFIETAKSLRASGLVTMAYLHTVLDRPDTHQKTVLQELAQNTDGLLVPTRSAVDILESDTYKIDRTKIKHIDHGIRMQNPSQYDRLAIKQQLHLEKKFLVTTLGLQSPDKGLPYGIRAYGRFISESLTEDQRKKIIYFIAGQCHPEFVQVEGGAPYRQFKDDMDKALDESGVRWCKLNELSPDKLDCCDIVLWDTFLDENNLMKLYGATNAVVLPYLNMQQISSGILADTVGSGRVAIATKFRYAVELLDVDNVMKKGLAIGSHARGILVDPGEDSVEQIAQALDFLVFNRAKRLAMEKRAHRRGYQMKWDNTAWAILQYLEFVKEQHDIVTGRGLEFTRQKASVFENKAFEFLSKEEN
jgi:glycosyltransferase involved in cell wall biosynthesis